MSHYAVAAERVVIFAAFMKFQRTRPERPCRLLFFIRLSPITRYGVSIPSNICATSGAGRWRRYYGATTRLSLMPSARERPAEYGNSICTRQQSAAITLTSLHDDVPAAAFTRFRHAQSRHTFADAASASARASGDAMPDIFCCFTRSSPVVHVFIGLR